MWFAEHNNPEGIRLALEHGDVLDRKYHPHRNLVFGHPEPTLKGYTPAHFAAKGKAKEALEMLISLGADLNLSSESGKKPYDIAISNNLDEISALLKKQGAVSNKDSYFEQCDTHKYAVVSMVTGLDRQQQPVAVLGRKINWEGKAKNEYLFPGGEVDPQDNDDPLKAALRELKEETGLDLNPLIESKKIVPERSYSYRSAGENNVLYTTTFFHFDLGNHLADLRVFSSDDLIDVRKVRLSEISGITINLWLSVI